jgi:hypothetical protein
VVLKTRLVQAVYNEGELMMSVYVSPRGKISDGEKAAS